MLILQAAQLPNEVLQLCNGLSLVPALGVMRDHQRMLGRYDRSPQPYSPHPADGRPCSTSSQQLRSSDPSTRRKAGLSTPRGCVSSSCPDLSGRLQDQGREGKSTGQELVERLGRSAARGPIAVVLHRLKIGSMMVLDGGREGLLQFLIPTNSSTRPS